MQDSPKDTKAKTAVEILLAEHRSGIDEIDSKILELLNRRLAIVKKVGQIKVQHGVQILDRSREKLIFQRLAALNEAGLLSQGALLRIFLQIINASREFQKYASAKDSRLPQPSVFAILGYPVGHSLSPQMHNTAFSAVGYNGIYIALESEHITPIADGLRTFGFQGASITIPHKVAIMDFLDELDGNAAKIKAVNTVVNRNGRLTGHNTDGSGAVQALAEKTALKDAEVAIIGAGGAARAIGFAVVAAGGRVTIVNRSTATGEKLADDLGANFLPLTGCEKIQCQVLINATPVGMKPDTGGMPVPKTLLEIDMVVMDIVYNPLKTKLLKTAAEIGCTTVDGVAMLVYQGAKQFELWTGLAAPTDIMRMAVLAEL